MPLTRRYEAIWCDNAGEIRDSIRLAPATPLFEEAFSALARGSVIATETGPVAVEDLVPGMRARTGEGGLETITWVGSMMIYPEHGAAEGRDTVRLTRITAEALGVGRPVPDLVLGPRARLCLRDPRLRAVIGGEAAYVPARAFIDGVSVIEVTPLAPVTVYHVVLENHGSLRVAGLEVEAFHPGEGVERMIDPRMLSLFEAQFPQLEGLAGFGPLAHPRLTRFEVESLWA
ncbi:Hint domain-containing protein [Rhodobacter maris]|nr:Hint domain-containing protein [Rhodobacter maris]